MFILILPALHKAQIEVYQFSWKPLIARRRGSHWSLSNLFQIFPVTVHTVTNGRVVWLIWCGLRIGYWIYSLWLQLHKLQSLARISSTAQAVHLDQLLQKLLLSTGSSLNPFGASWTKSSWSNQKARLAELLNPYSNCLLWAGTWPAFELPLDSWTASHYFVGLFLTVLFLLNPTRDQVANLSVFVLAAKE
jgi:hypothetical protein